MLKPVIHGVFLLGVFELAIHLMKWTMLSYGLLFVCYFITGFLISQRPEVKDNQERLSYTILILLVMSWTVHIGFRQIYPIDLFGIICLNVLTGFAILIGASVNTFRLYLKAVEEILKR